MIKKILYFAVILLLASSAFAQANLESSVISSTGTLDATNGTSALHYLIGQSVIGTAELPAGNAIEIGAIYGFIIGFPPITSGGGIVAKCREFNNNTMTTLSKKTFKVTMDGGAEQFLDSDASGNLIMTNIAPGIHQLTLVYNNGTDDFKVMIANVEVLLGKYTIVYATFVTQQGPGIAVTVMQGSSLISTGDTYFSYAIYDTGTANIKYQMPTVEDPNTYADSSPNGIILIPMQQADSDKTYDVAMNRSDSSHGRANGVLVEGTKYTSVTIIFSKLPAGTVPLTITRNGANIEVSWDVTNHTEYFAPKIFIRTGLGAGEYTDDYTQWTKIAENGDLVQGITDTYPGLSYTEGLLTHADQVGTATGVSEVYYKAIYSNVNEGDNNQDTGKPNLNSAWAVGKLDMTIVKGWNLIATPLTITSSPNFGENMNQAIGPDFTNGDQLWDYIDGNWDHINFGTSWDNKFNPERGNGYWLNITDLPEGQTTRKLTIIGDANMQTYSRQIKNGWNLIAGPYPQDLVDTETNFVMPGPADGDQLWSYLNGWDHINYAISSGVGAWSISPATTIPEKPEMKIELKAGQGYWYNNVGAGFRWQPKK